MTPPQPGAASPATILVVDDNAANRELAQATLDDEGYRVVLASSGAEALAALETARPDCVLLDIRMPDMDGFEVCRRMRALPSGADTPIIFVTALREVETFDQALRAGGDDFLTKPIRPTELIIRLQAALKLRRVSTERRDLVELLRRQRDDLMRAVLHKERLTAFLVHDLKNPVTAMQLAADLLLRDPTATARSKDIAGRIRRESQGLLRMIMDLLDISRADEGHLVVTRATTDVGHIVDETLHAFAVRAEASQVTLAAVVDAAHGHLDHDLFRRVLENLVENAIRHAPSDTTVTISTARRDGALEVRVADAGHGVPLDLRERIFDRFVQVDADAAAHGARTGRGLGLAFCKLVVEAHGGRIWVEDGTPGAVFALRLPDGD